MSDAAIFTKKAQKGTGANAVDGVCMISKSKVTWEPSDPSKAKPAIIEISAITRTQQAPGKPFIKLDTAAGPLILGFQSVADRDDAVELLKASKPAARPASAAASGDKLLVPTAAQATALFRADKDLESVYKSLVVSGILSEQEFWRTRQGQLKDALARGGAGDGTRSAAQRVGLPSAMLADVKPSADGQTEKVHFQLTPAVIQQIFAERPEMHRAYLAHVPHSMDEKAFWTRYFKQQYKRMARRRRQGLPLDGDDEEEDELFAPFKRQLQEQEAARAKQAVGRVDPTVNLAADAGERFSAGFGLLHDGARDPAAALRGAGLDSIARDVNRHAAVVLQGAPEALDELAGGGGGRDGSAAQQPGDTSRIAAALAAQQQARAAREAGSSSSGGDALTEQGGVSPERLAEWRQRAASALEDLTLDERDKQYAPLNIHDPRAYFDAAAGGGAADDGKQQQPQEQHKQPAGDGRSGGCAPLLAALAAVQPLALPDPPCDPLEAAAVLLDLSQDQDEDLVREFGPVAAAALQLPPQDRTHGLQPLLLEHLRGEALKTNELLRHFWGCMPLLSGVRADKAASLAAHLEEQRALLASHMRHHSGSSQQVHVTLMLRPLCEAIDAALARHREERRQRQQQHTAG